MTNEELWQSALGEIELSISKANFITWFKNTSIVSIEGGTVVIGVPNGFAKEWLENKYNLYILRALRSLKNDIKQVSCTITVAQDPFRNERSIDAIMPPKRSFSPVPSKKMANTSHESNLNPRYTFENFVVGGSNELAKAACFAASQSLGSVYNPLFIYGGVGLGKTHLLQSLGNEVLRKNPEKTVKYITSERFTSELIDSIKNQKINDFKSFYQKIDLLIIDDIQFLAGKEKTQEEFFHIFNFLYQLNRQIVISSDRPPKEIPTLEERLRSRFEGGMIADVSKADFETRMAILSKKALEKNLLIETDVLEFIASNITNNIRELEGAFNKVMVSSELSNKKITMEFVSDTLSGLILSGKKPGINHKHIIKAVAEFYDISYDELIVKNRKKEVVRPRQVAMYLLRSELQCSYLGIGEKLGGRDHTTAIHAYEKIKKELAQNKRLVEDINYLKEKIYNISV
ncbi:MAG: chromosomal replication initiator protein DnaA [Candidatus Moranbacteria bacterium CG10_big_fil_rev_8_21_14_0_10_35_21]|nr:MAG: chromosomal replication initiator protein DnaA [Candidatus Moranbacteria bacterium CG10_big_fil_rev_8_21_14_0_10_35_21]PJA88994.1 MAG: chromosomal replication initiator protein DnaA [Candidatus Moranbacteria bacterium CG_4_9_14_3_um_filter_36_9]